MAQKTEKKKIDFRYNLSEYWSYLREYKSLFIPLLFIMVITEVILVVPKFLFKKIIDDGALFSSGVMSLEIFVSSLIIILIIFLTASFIQIAGKWVGQSLIIKLDSKMMRDIKQKYFKYIMGLDYKFHTSNKTGSLISRIIRGSNAMENLNDIIIFNFVPLLLQLIIVGFSIAYFSISSALVVGAITIVFLSYSLFIQQLQQHSKLMFNEIEDAEKANVSDVFTNIDSIKYYGKEKFIGQRFGDITENTKDAAVKLWNYFKWLDVGHTLILAVGTFFLLYFPLMQFLAGDITLGTIVFIYTVYGNVMGPMFAFSRGMRGFYRSMADLQDLFKYGKIEREVKDKSGAKNFRVTKGSIEFKDISFDYGRRKVFENFSLKIPQNKKIALVGRSGCGKTSLLKLLYRFYNLDSGEILIDGKNINEFKQESLRAGMSIVPQECVLFDDTIYNNIKFSKPSATRGEVMRAIKFAQLDGIIEEMPEKENTIVGERGVKLSGGEKQRVSIARALLADKKILVLDEATSALDSETEHDIQRDLAKLMEGRTSIIIAHRLSTIMHADKIIVMSKGKIVESGTHRELIRRKGEYRKLWNLQKGGYIK